MKKNVRIVLLGGLLLLIVVFYLTVLMGMGGLSSVRWFIDFPSLLMLLLFFIPGLLLMGVWKDFIKSFSVGIRHYSLLELKNIIGAVDAAQKLIVFAALFEIISSGIIALGNISDLFTLGPRVAVCLLVGLYAVIIEFFLLPLRLNAERCMNKEMDLEDE